MKILVTGCAGFIGSFTCKRLIDRGDTIIGIDNINPYYDPVLKRQRLKEVVGLDRIRFYEGDITDMNMLQKIADENEIDVICHLAAQAGVRYSIESPFVFDKSNNLGTLNLFELARQRKIAKVVFASSSSVYGKNKKMPFSERDCVDNPISLYAATKKYNELLGHAYSHLYGIKMTGLRFFTVYGPYGRPDMAFFKFTKAILEGKPIDVYNRGDMKRDFTYIDDISDGIVRAIDRDFDFEIFNLGCSSPVELMHVIECLEKQIGRSAIKNLLPMQMGDVKETFSDITKAREMLGYDPKVKVEEGVKRFVNWYISRKDQRQS